MNYAYYTLNTQMAQNEFSSNKQFMLTAGLQVDDIAWTIGRTQTITYSSKFGFLHYNESVLDYTFQVFTSVGNFNFTSPATGIILYNMPISSYSPGDNYFERVPYSTNGSFLQRGSSAPVSQVFCQEKIFKNQTSYTRIALVPTIRMLNSTVVGSQPTSYFKFYLPYLVEGGSTYSSSPSVTITGQNVTKITETQVNKLIITVSPNKSSGFDSSFFNFPDSSVTLNINSSNSVVEFYFGEIQVKEGQP
jgi:hypothetical protein